MWGIIQITKLVNFPWPTPTPETHLTPSIMPMMSCDITWHHGHDVSSNPLDITGPLLCSYVKNFYLSLFIPWETFPHSHTSPHICLWIFETLQVIISWVWIIHKRLNVNWKKIHSIILSVTCHYLRNFPLFIHIPSYPFVNFQNPKSYYFLSLNNSWKVECEFEINSLKNFISHLSFLKKLSPIHTHSPISIHVNFWNPTQWLFLGFESFVKGWM